MASDMEDDPYAVSSDSESEEIKKPPPKIQIGERSGQLNQMKTALTEKKQSEKDAERLREIEELKAKNEATNIKKGFEMGKISASENAEMAAREKAERDEEKEKASQASKENYSKFKDKFERLDSTLEENLEEKLKKMERDQIGLGKDGLASALNRFEKGGDDDGSIQKEKVEINRSEADRKRILNAFHGGELILDDGPQDCSLCSKRVYPVERMVANRSIYHKNCFRCSNCNKKLLATNYGSHEGKLLCKGHLWEALHPGAAIPAEDIDSQEGSSESGDEEFAVTNKPRKVNKNIVKSGGMDINDELSQIRSLKEKKGEFESSVKNAENIERRSGIEEEIISGRVKENLGRFTNVTNDEGTKIQREELHFDQVGDIKNKWKTGQVETAEQKEAREKAELEALRGSGINVRERFKERIDGDGDGNVIERSYDATQLDVSLAAEARKSFMEGRAFESSGPSKRESFDEIPVSGKTKDFKEKFERGQGDITEIQKTQVEIDGISLGDLKNAFESKGRSTVNMTPEERAEQKQKEIEAEFLRYKLARKAATKRAQQMAESGEEARVIGGADRASGVGVGGIRETFNSGRAFNREEHGGKEGNGLDVEVRVAGKARAKFQQLDTNAQPIAPKEQRREPSKWDKKETSASGDIVNRRLDHQGEGEESEEEEEEFDVKNLMNKFKNIGDNDSLRAVNSEQRAELDKIRVQAKNLKQQFEQGHEDDHDAEEFKKREMEIEFERLKRERAQMQQRLQEEKELEEREKAEDKEEIGIKAEHASKMAAKWEKIHQKEARKAEKSRMPTRTGGQDH